MDKIIDNYSSFGNKIYYHHTVSKRTDKDYVFGPESHSQLEILYLLSDGIEYVIEGEHYNVNCGDAIVVLPHEIHTIISKTGYVYERVVIVFDINAVYGVISENTELLELFSSKVKGKRVIPKNVIDNSPLKDIFYAIMNTKQSEKYRGLSIASKIIDLTVELDKLLSSDDVELLHPSSVDPLIIDIIKYVDKHITDQLSLSDIAKKLFVSKSTLCHKFKNSMNMTLNQYYSIKKIKLAEGLIKSGLTAVEAGFKVGYNNYLTFYYNYKRITGHSPSQAKK